MISSRGLKFKNQTANPSPAGTGESSLYTQDDGLYLNGTKITGTSAPPASTNDLACYTSVDQTVAYPSSKQLSFNPNTLKQVATSATQTTLEIADTITKNVSFNSLEPIYHRTSNPTSVADIHEGCSTVYQANSAGDAEQYDISLMGLPSDSGGGVEFNVQGRYDGFLRPVLTARGNGTNREVYIGDFINNNNYIHCDSNHPNGGNFRMVKNNVEMIKFDGSNLNIEGTVLRIGNYASGKYVTIDSDGTLTGYNNGSMTWMMHYEGRMSGFVNGALSWRMNPDSTMNLYDLNNPLTRTLVNAGGISGYLNGNNTWYINSDGSASFGGSTTNNQFIINTNDTSNIYKVISGGQQILRFYNNVGEGILSIYGLFVNNTTSLFDYMINEVGSYFNL